MRCVIATAAAAALCAVVVHGAFAQSWPAKPIRMISPYPPGGGIDASARIVSQALTEPYITLAEKKGCRTICSAFFHGTEVASDRVDAETYAAFNRAVREAVRRINANKSAYMRYFIDYHKARDPEIGTLKPQDLREGRLVVVDPAPIPPEELQRTYEWVKSWGMLEQTDTPLQLVNMDVQARAHATIQ